MYDKVVNTVSNAVPVLPSGYTNHQIIALLYLQAKATIAPKLTKRTFVSPRC